MTENSNIKNEPLQLDLFDDPEVLRHQRMVDAETLSLFRKKSDFLLTKSKYNPFTFSEIYLRDFIGYIFERKTDSSSENEPFEERGSHEYTDIWLPQQNKEKVDYTGYGIWRYNPIVLYRTKKNGTLVNEHQIILKGDAASDKLDAIESRHFAIMSPITYVGRNRYAKNARYLYAFAFDLDGVGMSQMRDVLHQQRSDLISKVDGKPLEKSHTPLANIIVNSGHGLHMYYILEHPVPLFKQNIPLLRKMKEGLTNVIWNEFSSNLVDTQYQGIYQGFRLPGTLTKFGQKIRAFRNEDAPMHSIETLNAFLSKFKLTDKEIAQLKGKTPYTATQMTLNEAKRQFPDWYERRIVLGEKNPKKWHIKRDLYDWWLRRLRDGDEKIVPGHRYFCLLTLAIYAMKCDIEEEELKRDAFSLLERMDSTTEEEDNHFTRQDIEDALMGYKLWYCTFPRNSIKFLTGLDMKISKRNGRMQINHLKMARMMRDFKMEEKGIARWDENRGRKKETAANSKIAALIRDWRELHPDNLNKSACARELNLDRKTVRKWWDGDISASAQKKTEKTQKIDLLELTGEQLEIEQKKWEETHSVNASKLFAPGSTYTIPGFTHEELVDAVTSGRWGELGLVLDV